MLLWEERVWSETQGSQRPLPIKVNNREILSSICRSDLQGLECWYSREESDSPGGVWSTDIQFVTRNIPLSWLGNLNQFALLISLNLNLSFLTNYLCYLQLGHQHDTILVGFNYQRTFINIWYRTGDLGVSKKNNDRWRW